MAVQMSWVTFYPACALLCIAAIIWLFMTFGGYLAVVGISIPIFWIAGAFFIDACTIYASRPPDSPHEQEQQLMNRSIHIPKRPGWPEAKRDHRHR